MSAARPRFSIVTAVYDVEPYLPAFIDSIERQQVASDDLEIIAVDDGSTDGSRAILEAWAARSRFPVRVLSQPNGGQGAARNLGLDAARGEWVTFTDPDDMLDQGFFRAAGRFASTHLDVHLHSARPVLLYDATGVRTLAHPRRWQYSRGNRVADLDEEPIVFLGVTPGSLFRLDRIQATNLRFDTRIRPNFEDAHFAVRYLLDLPRHRIGLLADARYVYRKRATGTSTSQASFHHPGRYGAVLEHGYLDALERGRRPDGRSAPWIQQLIAYELSWYLSADDRITSELDLPPELAPRFLDLLGRVLRDLQPEVLERGGARALPAHLRHVLARGGRGATWHTAVLVHSGTDRTMGLRRLTYRFTGRAPALELESRGERVEPAFTKRRTLRYFGRDLLEEQIVWVPDRDDLTVRLGGAIRHVREEWPLPVDEPHRKPSLRDRLWTLRNAPLQLFVARQLGRGNRILWMLAAWLIRAAARLPVYRRFRDAWVVMDRVNNADDNGERLFEHLRAVRPDINAWFVVARDTPDWRRLRAARTGRLVAWGSFTWRMLMHNAAWLVSSHADRGLVAPYALLRREADRPWKYAFLQHGVIKDDLSLWLNQRDINLFVVSTQAELESVAGDGSGYVVTHKETRLTGLPRFDRLLAKGRAVPPSERDLVIVAPTWRTGLTLPIEKDSQRRGVDDTYWASDYHAAWMGVLRSPAIAEACARHGRRLAFMPHPNLQPILAQLELPPHVQAMPFEDTDVQALYARCALLVTDYSSVAFNLAYLDRPIVYFQFDKADMERGGHMGRKGYFEYERDGYGPVALDLAAAERAIVEAIEAGPQAAPAYQARIDAAFPVRDGGACARVVAAIEELSRPLPASPE